MKKIVRGILCLLVLSSLSTYLPSSGAVQNSALTSQNPTPAESISIYLMRLVVSTNSDWTTVNYTGISSVANNVTLLAGQNAPNLYYGASQGFIWISKKQYNQTLVSLETDLLALRGNDTGTVVIGKGGIGATNVSVYAYTGAWRLHTTMIHSGVYSQTPTNARSFLLNYSAIYSAENSTATLDSKPVSLEKRVFAFYYPWYGSSSGPSGGMRHWQAGIAHHPTFGLYDSNDRKIIEAHMRMARAAGIDGFIVSWWGPYTFEDQAFANVLSVADSLDFSVTIYYESYRPWEGNISVRQIVDEMAYVIQSYSSHPSFMRANGVPAMLVYSVGAWNRSPSFWTEVRSGLLAKVGRVYLIGDTEDPKYAGAFDGFHWYAQTNVNKTSGYFSTYRSQMRIGFEGLNPTDAMAMVRHGKAPPLEYKILGFTVTPGFQCAASWCDSLSVPRNNGTLYRQYWQNALAANPDCIFVTSWNEWHEGTEIEPSTEFGFAYLQLTRQFTQSYKGTQSTTSLPQLRVQSGIQNVTRYGMRSFSILVSDTSPTASAVYVGLGITLGSGIMLEQVQRNVSYAYIEESQPQSYRIMIPMLRPGELAAFNLLANVSVGPRQLTTTVTGDSVAGESTEAARDDRTNVVFDRVVVNLHTAAMRVNVGSAAPVTWDAYYEYDHNPFVGTLSLNDTLRKDSVGRVTYTVGTVSDELYGLKTFSANSVRMVFDEAIVTLKASDRIVPLGGSANIAVSGVYAYDNSPFVGKVFLNDSMTKDKPGNYTYTVSGIQDEKYGLTAFASNAVSVEFMQAPTATTTTSATAGTATQPTITRSVSQSTARATQSYFPALVGVGIIAVMVTIALARRRKHRP